MAAELPHLIQHLELHFGRIIKGWSSPDKADSRIQVVECRDGMIPDVDVICTLGLSNYALESHVSRKRIRQELFIMTKLGQIENRLSSVLDQLASERAKSKLAVLRGEVIVKENSLLEKGNFVAFYATLPIYYPQSLWSLHDVELGDIVLSWLVPIKSTELAYVHEQGWSAFEEIVDKAGFDLFDLARPSLI